MISKYQDLMRLFLDYRISVEDFQKQYLELFKNEKQNINESAFEVLDTLFGDVDSYTNQDELIRDNPQFYLNEQELRSRVSNALDNLKI